MPPCLISTTLEIKFSNIIHEIKIETPKDDKCDELSYDLMEQMRQLENANKKLSRDDIRNTSRILVFEIDEKNKDIDLMHLTWEKHQTQNYYAYCYTIKKAAEFGVCKTTISNDYSPRLQK